MRCFWLPMQPNVQYRRPRATLARLWAVLSIHHLKFAVYHLHRALMRRAFNEYPLNPLNSARVLNCLLLGPTRPATKNIFLRANVAADAPWYTSRLRFPRPAHHRPAPVRRRSIFAESAMKCSSSEQSHRAEHLTPQLEGHGAWFRLLGREQDAREAFREAHI